MKNQGILEGLLFFVGDEGLSLEEIVDIMNIEEKEANNLINKLKEEYIDEKRGFTLAYLGNKYKLTTKDEHKKYYEDLVDSEYFHTLSQPALETLAIIAYNQPITVGQIDECRGISSREMVRKLLFRELIIQCGKSDLPGKPTLYKTTDKFLDYFNLSSLGELPKIDNDTNINNNIDLFSSKYIEE
ncbi:MAG TPA: SMC-Scp complex subunit ScpB [Bacilli bacterium]|nr:SMC-Scp complex subunit ScpB [Bacilli bacterium]